MPAWAPKSGDGGARASGSPDSKSDRRPSLGGGMPAWAPKVEKKKAVMGQASVEESERPRRSQDVTLVVPDWLAAVADGGSRRVSDSLGKDTDDVGNTVHFLGPYQEWVVRRQVGQCGMNGS